SIVGATTSVKRLSSMSMVAYAIFVTMEHDASYKLLFSHARMVEDLLRGFVHEAWVREVDFTSLERVSGRDVSADLREREDDMIWWGRWGASSGTSICCWNVRRPWIAIWPYASWSTSGCSGDR